MKKQIIFFIHGIGKQKEGYSKACQDEISAFINDYRESKQHINILFKEILWSDLTQDVQDLFKERFEENDILRTSSLRNVMIDFIGDALAYQKSDRGQNIYDGVHRIIDKAREEIANEFSLENVEYTIVAHSLGTVIMSDYLHNNRDEFVATNFFTLGSPIALWCMRLGFPEKANSPILVNRPDGVWINIYDDDDIVAWPLRSINKYYADAVDLDYKTEVGPLFIRHTAMSHTHYWTDNNTTKAIAKKLAIDQERLANGVEFNKTAYLNFIDSLWQV